MAKYQQYDRVYDFIQGVALVEKDLKYGAIMVGGKEIIKPIYLKMSNFDCGYSKVQFPTNKIKDTKEERIINLSGQIQVNRNGEDIFLPSEYDWGFDYKYGLCIVAIGNKFGVIDNNFKIILDVEYDYISIETEGIIIIGNKTKDNGYYYYKYGMISNEGETILPIEYTIISSILIRDKILWIISQNKKRGVFDGKINIIPIIFDSISVESECLLCQINGKYNWENKVKLAARYNSKGEFLINIMSATRYLPVEFDLAYDAGLGLIRVMKNGKWGVINFNYDEVIPIDYSYIDEFHNQFAIVGNTLSDSDPTVYLYTAEEKLCLNAKYGIIDSFGAIIIPLEYDRIIMLSNGCYAMYKDGICTLFSPNLKYITESKTCYYESFDDHYVLLVSHSGGRGIMDTYGTVIISEDTYFEKVDIIDNKFIIITYSHNPDDNKYKISIQTIHGKEICSYITCNKVIYLQEGLFKIVDGDYCHLINIQGEDIFEENLKNIELQDNGLLAIESNIGWGIADAFGKYIVPPRYRDRIDFHEGYCEVSVKGCTNKHKINTKGQIYVNNGDKEIMLPKKYFWGTNFYKGNSIVRACNYDCYRGALGIINEEFNEIIKPQYDSLEILSNNMISAKKDNLFGLLDLNGNIILPTKYTSIDFISENSIRADWNLEEPLIRETRSELSNKFTNCYEIDKGASLFNSKGEKIINNEISYVGNFVNDFAVVYGKPRLIHNDRCILYVGVINNKGEIIIPIEYDSIVLKHNHTFAKLKKNGKYGIANILTGQIKMFEDIDIKHTEDIDKFGRMEFSTEGEYIEYNEDIAYWEGNRGLLSMDGIIIPTGKYDGFTTLDNGLIRIWDEKNNKFGLLNKKGIIILPIEYTMLHSNTNGYSSVCFGGELCEEEDEIIIGGKWGIIYCEGNFIQECDSSVEPNLNNFTQSNQQIANIANLNEITVLLSDSIPCTRIENTQIYLHNDTDYYYDEYDDLYHDAFEGDPEYEWNID